jgi:hypothetical protein
MTPIWSAAASRRFDGLRCATAQSIPSCNVILSPRSSRTNHRYHGILSLTLSSLKVLRLQIANRRSPTASTFTSPTSNLRLRP